MKPHKYLFSYKDLPLFEPTAVFSYCQVLYSNKMEKQIATFDVFVRDLPKNRNFLILGGIEEIISYIINYKYDKKYIKYLLKTGIIKNNFAKHLFKYKFSGSINAMPEGTIFFPGEPIIRITAPIIEANLMFLLLVNTIASNTIFMSKAVRSCLAANGKPVLTNGGRAQSFESGMKYVRAAYLVGMEPALQLSPIIKYNISLPNKLVKSTFHAFIKAFNSEYEAMKAFALEFPDNEATIIVDTYDFKKGIDNVIKLSNYLKKRNKKILSIFIDSGDLYKNSCYARKKLDRAGFKDIKILVASNLNEERIADLERKEAPIDSYMGITEIATSYDDPKLEVVYKMAQLQNGKKVRQTMKLAHGKKSYPGIKQVYRIIKYNKMVKDVVGLENEKIKGMKLLTPIIKDGKLIYKFPNIEKTRELIKEQLNLLPSKLKKIKISKILYKVKISKKLKKLAKNTQKKMH